MNTTRRSDKTLSVAIKLQLVVFSIVLLIIGIQTGLNIRNARQRNETETEQNLIALYNEFKEDIQILEKTAAALSLGFASRPDIQERFGARDRQGILALLEPVFTTLNTDYDIVHLQFHEPNGTVFLRVHDPEQYGDYTFTYRRANAQAIISRQTNAGIEIDPNRLGIQGVSPVFHQGQFVGLVEVGLDYDRAFLEDFKARTGADCKMWVLHKDAAPAGLGPLAGAPESPLPELFYYAGTDPTPLSIPAEVYHTVLRDGEPQIQFVSAGEQELAVLVAPMLGYGDRVIGILDFSISRTEALAALRDDQLTTLTLAGGLALLGLTLMWILIGRVVLRPLGHLTTVAQRQLEGDLTTRVELLPRDELGQLGHTLNVLTRTLDNTLQDQEDIIAERTARYRSLFEDSPISLWEQDFSEGKRYIDGLGDSGVADFRAYFDDHPEAVARCVDMVKTLDVNQATLELVKARSKEDLYVGLGTVFSEESFDVFREELIALAEGETRFKCEATIQTLTGEKVHTALSLAVAPGYEETWSKVFVSIKDITERVRAEEALRESEERFRTLVENVPVGVYRNTPGPKGRFLMVNPALLSMFGFDSEEELKGTSVVDTYVHASERKAFSDNLLAQGSVSGNELQLKKKDGSLLWGSVTARVVHDEGGEVAYFDGVIQDITERKRAEEALRESSQLMQSIFDAMPDAITIMDVNQNVTSCNQSVQRVLGYTTDELIGKNYSTFVSEEMFTHPKQKAREAELFEKGHLELEEYYFKRKNGEVFPGSFSAALLRDAEGNFAGIVGTMRDITERVRAEEELRKHRDHLEEMVEERTAELQERIAEGETLNRAMTNLLEDLQVANTRTAATAQRLEEANAELESFSYSVSHDLRAPLRRIDGFSQALLEDYQEQLDEQGVHYLHRIRKSTQLMGQLIDDILKLSRVTRAEMRHQQVDLTALAQDILTELRRAEPERQVALDIEEGLVANGDERLLELVLENLLSNAWKFTSKKDQARIEFSSSATEDQPMVYCVRDNGAGFDMAYTDKLFGVFQRLHTTTEFPGTGVGLATVQRVIHRHGGRIWAKGAVDQGATFYFTLE